MKFKLFNKHTVCDSFMEPTYPKGLTLLMVAPKPRRLRRGAVVVYQTNVKNPATYIARIIGLPGESVDLCSRTVFINNRRLYEYYVDPEKNTYSYKNITLGQDEYWLMGDNRAEAVDSRHFGPIKQSDILKVMFHEINPKGGNK